jgi:hypothetical protein
MVRPQGLFPDLKSATEQRLGFSISALAEIARAETEECDRRIDAFWTGFIEGFERSPPRLSGLRMPSLSG